MSDYNFLPSVMRINFYRGERGLDEDQSINEIFIEDYDESKGPDVFELGFEITLTGLDRLVHPMMTKESIKKYFVSQSYEEDSEYRPFYINTMYYTQRGSIDTIVHGISSTFIDVKNLKKGIISLAGTITKFRNDDKSFIELLSKDLNTDFKYDFVSNYFAVKFFITEGFIDYGANIYPYLIEQHQTLFETKIPIRLPKVYGNYNDW